MFDTFIQALLVGISNAEADATGEAGVRVEALDLKGDGVGGKGGDDAGAGRGNSVPAEDDQIRSFKAEGSSG